MFSRVSVRFALALILAALFSIPQMSFAQLWEREPEKLTDSGGTDSNPVIIWCEHGFAVVWFRSNQLRYTLLDENCDQAKQPVTIYSTYWEFQDKVCDIAYRDGYFYVVFLEPVTAGKQVMLQRVHYNYDPVGARVQLTTGSYSHAFPRLVWNGKEFGLAYIRAHAGQGGYDVMFQRFNSQMEAIGQSKYIAAGSENKHFLDLVWSGKFWGLAWMHDTKTIVFQRLKRNGRLKQARRTVFSYPGAAYNPKGLDLIVRDGKAYALAFSWRKDQSEVEQVYFQRLRRNGKNLGQPVRASNTTVGARFPAVTWDALQRHYGVFWSDGRDKGMPPSYGIGIYATLLDARGVDYVRDYALDLNQSDDYQPAVANNGDVAVLVYTAQSGLKADIYAVKMICEAW